MLNKPRFPPYYKSRAYHEPQQQGGIEYSISTGNGNEEEDETREKRSNRQ
jgi:hypothetical protein